MSLDGIKNPLAEGDALHSGVLTQDGQIADGDADAGADPLALLAKEKGINRGSTTRHCVSK